MIKLNYYILLGLGSVLSTLSISELGSVWSTISLLGLGSVWSTLTISGLSSQRALCHNNLALHCTSIDLAMAIGTLTIQIAQTSLFLLITNNSMTSPGLRYTKPVETFDHFYLQFLVTLFRNFC